MRIAAALAAAWEFVAGDDWQTALGIVLALGLTALVAAIGAGAWWVMPLAAMLLLRSSVRRRGRRRPGRVGASTGNRAPTGKL